MKLLTTFNDVLYATGVIYTTFYSIVLNFTSIVVPGHLFHQLTHFRHLVLTGYDNDVQSFKDLLDCLNIFCY